MSYPIQSTGIPFVLPRTIYGWALRELRANPAQAVVFVLGGTVHALAHGAVAWCAAWLAHALVADSATPSRFGSLSPAWIAAIGLGAVVLKGVAGTLATFSQSRLSAHTGQVLRDTVIAAVLQQGLQASTPNAIARLASRVREAEQSVQDGALATARAIAQLLPILASLWLLSPRLTLAATAVLAPFGWFLSRGRRRWKRWHQDSMQASDELHEEVDDLIRNADLWRSYGTGSHIRTVVRDRADRAGLAKARSETFRTALSSTNEVLAALALVLAMGAASLWSWAAASSLIAFAAVFFMAYKPLRDLGDARAAHVRGKEALESLAMLSFSDGTAGSAGQKASPVEGNDLLEVERLSVPGRTPTVSFALQPGRTLAITGPTGAGKTSLLRALLGLEREATGEVRFRGEELRNGAVGPHARPFAWVPQDAPVITGTLSDNFALAGVDRADGEAELTLLGASDLREGISNVKVGAGGRSLSGGERRWISLARALATREPILLLDEPTVGLDASAKELAMRTLRALRGHRSMVIVTHDADVAAMADEVIVLERDAHRGADARLLA